MTSIPDVNWSRIAGFVRQHTHDLRNELNGLDLEAALLADIVTDPEAMESVSRIRAEIRKVAANLRSLSGKFAETRPNPLLIAGRELFLIWKDQLAELKSTLEVEWVDEVGEEQVNVDPGAVAQAFQELLRNAQSFAGAGKLRASVSAQADRVVFELREPKVESIDPSRWGKSPFSSGRRGSYGLGLCSLLRAIEANNGTVSWHFDSETKELVTAISFQAAPAESVEPSGRGTAGEAAHSRPPTP